MFKEDPLEDEPEKLQKAPLHSGLGGGGSGHVCRVGKAHPSKQWHVCTVPMCPGAVTFSIDRTLRAQLHPGTALSLPLSYRPWHLPSSELLRCHLVIVSLCH